MGVQVRREIDNLREGMNERMKALHKEAVKIENDAAEEIAAMKRGETPEPRTEYVMHKSLEDDEEEDDGTQTTYVHEDEYEQGGLLVPKDDDDLSASGEDGQGTAIPTTAEDVGSGESGQMPSWTEGGPMDFEEDEQTPPTDTDEGKGKDTKGDSDWRK